MSKITTVYDTLLTILTAIFPEKTRLFDAYTLSDNPEHICRDAYGVRKGDTSSDQAEFCSFTDAHGFEVVLTREVVRAESQLTPLDDQVKGLLEDAFELRQRVYRFDELGIPTDITAVNLEGVTAVEQFIAGKGKFISIGVSFRILVQQDL